MVYHLNNQTRRDQTYSSFTPEKVKSLLESNEFYQKENEKLIKKVENQRRALSSYQELKKAGIFTRIGFKIDSIIYNIKHAPNRS